MTTRVVFSVVNLNCNEDWSATVKFRKVLTVESTSCLGYFKYDIAYLRRLERVFLVAIVFVKR